MSTKTKSDVKVLKGQEAEDKILEYLKKMNRPFGAVDVAANLKGAVSKTTTQKALVTLAEKGELVQKTYGKSTFFVANQAKIEAVPAEDIAALERECKKIDEGNKLLAAEVKVLTAELTRLKATPTNDELEIQIATVKTASEQLVARLEPLRAGTTLISAQDIAQIDTDWTKWRVEWIHRKKIFNTFWSVATDPLPPQDASALAEDLGIEFDTPEHTSLERSPLCMNKSENPLKRKR